VNNQIAPPNETGRRKTAVRGAPGNAPTRPPQLRPEAADTNAPARQSTDRCSDEGNEPTSFLKAPDQLHQAGNLIGSSLLPIGRITKEYPAYLFDRSAADRPIERAALTPPATGEGTYLPRSFDL